LPKHFSDLALTFLATVKGAFERDYDDITLIGEGGTSVVFSLLRRGINHPRVVKVLKFPTSLITVTKSDGKVVSRDLNDLFRREIKHVMAVNHPNVVKVYDAGVLQHDAQEHQWYMMEHLSEPKDLDDWVAGVVASKSLTATLLVDALTSAARGLRACHLQKITHGDVKPANIQVTASGWVYLVDFGFSKSQSTLKEDRASKDTLWFGDRDFLDDELLDILALQKAMMGDRRVTAVALDTADVDAKRFKYERSSLGKTMRHLLQIPGVRTALGDQSGALDEVASRLLGLGPTAVIPYPDLDSVIDDLRHLAPGHALEGWQIEFNPYLNDGITIPVSGRVPKSDRVAQLLQLQAFQRLRDVRQLGLTHWIYPGAVHTRFEHSLGVFTGVLKYVKALYSNHRSAPVRMLLRQQELSAVMVAALVHDMGHYPMAHAFEEVEPSSLGEYKHSEILRRMLEGELPNVLPEADRLHLSGVLEREFGITVKDVLAVANGGRTDADRITRPSVAVLNSMLDGPLDADKLDYILRDALHCGVPFGEGIDVEAFLRSLCLDAFDSPIAVREKGVPAVEALFLARYYMFLRVYWHHTNRAMERMVTEAVRICREAPRKADRPTFLSEFKDLSMQRTDDALLEWLESALPHVSQRDDLIRPLRARHGRRHHVFRRVRTYRNDGSGKRVNEQVRRLFEYWLDGTSKYGYPYLALELRRRLLDECPQGTRPHEILLDVPDPRVRFGKRLDGVMDPGFVVYSESGGTAPIAAREASAVFRDFLFNWDLHAMKIRVFATPSVAEGLRARPVAVDEAVEDVLRKATRLQPAELLSETSALNDWFADSYGE